MAKQVIVSAIEEVLGEYILNLDKDSIRLSLLRGNIKLENVELDGDLLGSHVLGVVGLQGFAILSCWAKSLKIKIPYHNLENEPTRFEMKGVHLLCLPLLPSTAGQIFGRGTKNDPRCTLRTRAKRSKLMTFENNFMAGRILGEGPPSTRVLRAVKDVERALSKRQHRKSRSSFDNDKPASWTNSSDLLEDTNLLDSLTADLLDAEKIVSGNDEEPGSASVYGSSSSYPADFDETKILEIPRDWKVRLKEKIFRNLEASMENVHIRCELPEGGLDFRHHETDRPLAPSTKKRDRKSPDQRAFALGFTLESFVMQTADENWNVGSHEKHSKTSVGTAHLGPNPYDERNNKLISCRNISMYWDDSPPFLISQTKALRSTDHGLSTEKLQLRIGAAMAALLKNQEPGRKVRDSLEFSSGKQRSNGASPEKSHEFICESMSFQLRHKTSDRLRPGPISCRVEFLDFNFNLKLRPHQYVQYQKMKSAMLSQKRFDTMLRQRPNQTPLESPRSWWKYAISCVIARPNSRPWHDVLKICRSRNRYIDLVVKKVSCMNNSNISGFTEKFSDEESEELLSLQDKLPIEALQAFHLLALRRVVAEIECKGEHVTREAIPPKSKFKRIFRGAKTKPCLETQESSGSNHALLSAADPFREGTLLEMMKERLGKKPWFIDFRWERVRFNVSLLSASNLDIVKLQTEACGYIQFLGVGKRNYFFDITKFEVVDSREVSDDFEKRIFFVSGSLHPDILESKSTGLSEILGPTEVEDQTDESGNSDKLPPLGTVCRLLASKNVVESKVNFSAHPATLVWTRQCFDAIAEFFGAPSTEMQTELTLHLRNAATPLARKAQLALLSPSSLSVNVNVAAPKVWIPFHSTSGDGALFLDAGHFRLTLTKEEPKLPTTWSAEARNIQISFAKSMIASPFLSGMDSLHHPLSPVIRPFHIEVFSDRDKPQMKSTGSTVFGESSNTEVKATKVFISPICINFVDLDELAKAIGKWYARGILRVRGRAMNDRRAKNIRRESVRKNIDSEIGLRTKDMRSLSVTIEKVEMALEGHSKSFTGDDKSVHSHETSLAEFSTPVRTYVVEIFDIHVTRSASETSHTTNLTVSEVSIVQLQDSSDYAPMKARHKATDLHYAILGRGRLNGRPDYGGEFPDHQVLLRKAYPHVLSAKIFHDEKTHVDEVEVDIVAILLRVTPTSLKDCAKAIRKCLELVQVVTREMERKIHESGRNARARVYGVVEPCRSDLKLDESASQRTRPDSPAFSLVSDVSDPRQNEAAPRKEASDSSLLFKVTIKESSLLAGRPTEATNRRRSDRNCRQQTISFAVVQVCSNALIMFQSIENPDSSGVKTLHLSLDNLSASVVADFDRAQAASPMIGPTGFEFRMVNSTENFGVVVSREVSFDCENLKSCLTPGDMFVLLSVLRTMLARLYYKHPYQQSLLKGRPKNFLNSIFMYQERGAMVATNIRLQCHSTSFILLRPYHSKVGAPEFLSMNIKDFKARFGGCISALSGECSANLSIDFYNDGVSSWEYAVEPFQVILNIDQMPEEVILDLSIPSPVHMNFTGLLLQDLASIDVPSFLPSKSHEHLLHDFNKDIAPSVLRQVGLRRATEAHSLSVCNNTGLDLLITVEGDGYERPTDRRVSFESIGPGLVRSGHKTNLDLTNEHKRDKNDIKFISDLSLGLALAPTATTEVGEREQIRDLPATSSSGCAAVLHILHPRQSGKNTAQSRAESHKSEASRADAVGEGSSNTVPYYLAEPVVESCFQNQRLRSSIADIFSLKAGRDLLSSAIWSPEEETSIEHLDLTGFRPIKDFVGFQEGERLRVSHRSNWLRPYLKNDAPEWTDMTCILEMARDRVMLPDTNWIWVNEWTVDVSGLLGEQVDSDGWSYEADFETFRRTKRYYQRGDCCRRRRWTRTRIVRPPRLEDPLRPLKIVWETKRDNQGNFSIEIKSNLTLHNSVDMPLSIFLYSPSWNEEHFVGHIEPNCRLNVPVTLASAVYLRLATPKSSCPSKALEDYFNTEFLMILPTGFDSSSTFRSSMRLSDITETYLHFLVEITSTKGIVDIYFKPILRLINLLPCHLECQFGEVNCSTETSRKAKETLIRPKVISPNIISLETTKIKSGQTHNSVSVNPLSKPHVSLRVPGYHWSQWYRIINRRANSLTWRPVEPEEDVYGTSSANDGDWAEELTTAVSLQRLVPIGDPLKLVMSLEYGHVPTLRIYSKYWVLDRTGFGCRFCEGFTDLLGNIPDAESTRRSHLPPEESLNPRLAKDLDLEGHQWSIGMSGMTMFHSTRERISLCIENETHRHRRSSQESNSALSRWSSPLDISNVMPRTVFGVDDCGGHRRFELAISVSVCAGIFGRTKLITFVPRYQIVNLLKREIVIAQDGCLEAATVIPSQSVASFHWEMSTLPPKVRLGAPSNEEKSLGEYKQCWTNGSIQLDKIGITSMRLPSPSLLPKQPMVAQAEIRLASKDQHAAVVLVLWSASADSNPLYLLRNDTEHTIICRQTVQNDALTRNLGPLGLDACGPETTRDRNDSSGRTVRFECGSDISPSLRSFYGNERSSEFVWVLQSGDACCFGFDDPERLHILEWTSIDGENFEFNSKQKTAMLEVDAMGSSSRLQISCQREIECHIRAEYSTKVIQFSERRVVKANGPLIPLSHNDRSNDETQETSAGLSDTKKYEQEGEDDLVAVKFRFNLPSLSISCIDNTQPAVFGREILLAHFKALFFTFSQSQEGYYEMEITLKGFQIDNHMPNAIHPVLFFCPSLDDREPFLHVSAVQRLQNDNKTRVFRYAAIRILEIDLSLDRCTVETMARIIEPLRIGKEADSGDHLAWLVILTSDMEEFHSMFEGSAPKTARKAVQDANSGRIYFEQLHLHPIRLTLTFTQDWGESSSGTDSFMLFQFIRGMASIADAPLRFASFVVGHVFESPQTLLRVIMTHYSSQLTNQIFGILGSLAIFVAPADFLSNVGSGVLSFFIEPINGAVHGPRQFIEGLEAGTQSLARGVFVGVVRGAANVTEAVNSNLVGLTADHDFIDERKAHQRMLTDALSRGIASRSIKESFGLAGSSVARALRSGALGLVEQPTRYASKHGPVGFVKGLGIASVGAVVKPIIGVGDAAALLMNHVSDVTSNNRKIPKIPIRLRRALPSRSIDNPNSVILVPYDERAAKAQKIVTGGESVNDVYLGHVNIPTHLIIASQQCLWAIDRRTREPWCASWEDISHFGSSKGGLYIVVFSQLGLKPYHFSIDSDGESEHLIQLLSMQLDKLGNSSNNLVDFQRTSWDVSSKFDSIPGFQSHHKEHTFGSFNKTHKRLPPETKDEIDLIEQCFGRVKQLGKDSPDYFETLDDEASSLIAFWGQMFSGLSSRRCIAAGLINGTGGPIQIKSAILAEGGSPCYSIPTSEFDTEQGMLHAGGSMIFFGYGVVPSLLQAGNVFMHIETNAFISDLSDSKGPETSVEATPGYLAGFLEKSYDEAGWWAKYWILVRKS